MLFRRSVLQLGETVKIKKWNDFQRQRLCPGIWTKIPAIPTTEVIAPTDIRATEISFRVRDLFLTTLKSENSTDKKVACRVHVCSDWPYKKLQPQESSFSHCMSAVVDQHTNGFSNIHSILLE